ncbi:hypothetical protein EVAR_20918_1 [Eumeta japonica]|uniref:Uncharacterized protein n=1 Tax=Eumeta variegata TaxID=151549 RepID=A0A4C1UVJ4_EUMVA|nr:hypothetical protein EVAR_20918_1 [Eumeta japonica]
MVAENGWMIGGARCSLLLSMPFEFKSRRNNPWAAAARAPLGVPLMVEVRNSLLSTAVGGRGLRRRLTPPLVSNKPKYMGAASGVQGTIKQKWSTSLRSRHIVDLALSESDQSLRSPGPARIPSPAIPDRSSAQPSPSSSTSSPQFKRPKTVNVPDFNQPKNQAQADSEWGVSTDVEECTSGTKKLLMELGINKLGEAREILYVIEIEDTEHDIMSQVSNLVAPFPASTIQPASTHQVITFPDVHVSADEDMPSSSRTFRVSSPTEALWILKVEVVMMIQNFRMTMMPNILSLPPKEIQQNLSDDEELPPQVRKKNNKENVDDCDERAEAGRAGSKVGD